MKKSAAFACLLIFILALSASGDELDSSSTEALTKTQALLQNPSLRDKAVSASPSAQTVDAQVKALAGNPQNADEIYKISGKVLEDLAKETGGDPAKMLQIVTQAQGDPSTLMNHLSDDSKNSIHSVSTQIDNAPTTRAPAGTP
jgi:hypothetical protein